MKSIISIFKIQRCYIDGTYEFDNIEKVSPNAYSLSQDKKDLTCNLEIFDWITDSPSSSNTYYVVRYYYEASLAESSEYFSTKSSKEEVYNDQPITA